jgi:hypothetical protein
VSGPVRVGSREEALSALPRECFVCSQPGEYAVEYQPREPIVLEGKPAGSLFYSICEGCRTNVEPSEVEDLLLESLRASTELRRVLLSHDTGGGKK